MASDLLVPSPGAMRADRQHRTLAAMQAADVHVARRVARPVPTSPADAAVIFQAHWRGIRARRLYKRLLSEQFDEDEHRLREWELQQLREGEAQLERHRLHVLMEEQAIMRKAREHELGFHATVIQRAFRDHLQRTGRAHLAPPAESSPSTVEASDLDELDSVFEPPHTPPPRRMQDAAVPNDEQPTLRSTGDAGPAAPGNGLVTSPNALLSSPMRPSSPTLAALTAKRAALKGAIETVSSQLVRLLQERDALLTAHAGREQRIADILARITALPSPKRK
eukprot:m.140147 g.140147  ORF g.140147 m.140147 type:complete len:280 (-) comp9625_c0_seq13:1441-2280(-)